MALTLSSQEVLCVSVSCLETHFFRPQKDLPDKDLISCTNRPPKIGHRLRKVLPQHFLFTSGNKIFAFIQHSSLDDCNLNDDDDDAGGDNDDDNDNYLTLGPNYMLGSVLMALHAILFLEITDNSGFDF